MKVRSVDPRQALKDEVAAFREWANERFPAGSHRHGEWECDYENWPGLYSAYGSHLEQYRAEQWTTEDADLLLYALARDNEIQTIQIELERKPPHLLELARISLIRTCDYEARWQLADALPSIRERSVEPVLEMFFADEHEYVRRIALLSLGKIGSLKVEEFAPKAWQSEDEYHRMCALFALRDISSPQLPAYLEMAAADGREYLLEAAARIRGGTTTTRS